MHKPRENDMSRICIGAVLAFASGIAAIVVTLSRLGDAGRMNQAMRRLNGASNSELANRGLSRSGEVNRIFG